MAATITIDYIDFWIFSYRHYIIHSLNNEIQKQKQKEETLLPEIYLCLPSSSSKFNFSPVLFALVHCEKVY